MIDHEARDRLRQAIDGFLSDGTGSSAFVEQLLEIERSTEDYTVQFVASQLWFTYCDAPNHLVRLEKQPWNAVQRLLLLLESKAEIVEHRVRIWHVSQILAAISLAQCVLLFWWKPDLWLSAILLGGAISLALASWRNWIGARHRTPDLLDRPDPWQAWPFPSLQAVRRALDRAPGFRKQKHRPEIVERVRRPSMLARLGAVEINLPPFVTDSLVNVAWRFFSPFILLVQCLPLTIYWQTFVEPDEPSADAA